MNNRLLVTLSLVVGCTAIAFPVAGQANARIPELPPRLSAGISPSRT